MSSKIYAICSGGDWADASVDHLVIPEGIDMEKEAWKCNKYRVEIFYKDRSKKYYTFVNWLIEKCGARKTTEDELEEFWEN